MALCIIANCNNSNSLHHTIRCHIEDVINAFEANYGYVDLHEYDFKRCTGEKCADFEREIFCPYGCKKSNTCIKEHNNTLGERLLISISDFENLVFLFDLSDSDSRSKFYFLSNIIMWNKRNSDRTSRQKAMYVILDNRTYSHIDLHRLDDLVNKSRLEYIDLFYVTPNNSEYMLHVLEVALSSLHERV